jgi:hypothetical protein
MLITYKLNLKLCVQSSYEILHLKFLIILCIVQLFFVPSRIPTFVEHHHQVDCSPLSLALLVDMLFMKLKA